MPFCQVSAITGIAGSPSIVKVSLPKSSHLGIQPHSLLMSTIDRTQIEQVLINLIKNALEATDGCCEPCITLSIKQQLRGREVCITVEDNGVGIATDVLDNIFVPFFTTKIDGSGIGLSICKQVITLHGGTRTATSTIGKGSLFTIILPL